MMTKGPRTFTLAEKGKKWKLIAQVIHYRRIPWRSSHRLYHRATPRLYLKPTSWAKQVLYSLLDEQTSDALLFFSNLPQNSPLSPSLSLPLSLSLADESEGESRLVFFVRTVRCDECLALRVRAIVADRPSQFSTRSVTHSAWHTRHIPTLHTAAPHAANKFRKCFDQLSPCNRAFFSLARPWPDQSRT